MGKQKFTVEEGSKISTFIRKWRKNNPNATEWPLDEIQQKLQLSYYSKLQIKNKIRSLQKREKSKSSPAYNDMCLRLSTNSSKPGAASSGKPGAACSSKNFDVGSVARQTDDLPINLDVVRQMILTANPSKVFDGWFQLQVHAKAKLGGTIKETWNKIVEHWAEIRKGIPAEILLKLKETAQGTKYSHLVFEDNDLSKSQKCHVTKLDESSGDESEPGDPIVVINENESESESADLGTVMVKNNLIPNHKFGMNLGNLYEQSQNNAHIPLKYMVSNNWTFSKSKELEPLCTKFRLTGKDSTSASDQIWPVLVPVMANLKDVWPTITRNDTWKELLRKVQMKADPVVTKLEFFREILPKRDLFFDMQIVKMNMLLTPSQNEAHNLIFYTLYHAKSFAAFQRLIDDGLLSGNYLWHVWIFIVKAKIIEDPSGNLFGATALIQSIVNERLDALIFEDGMSLVYQTVEGKPTIERLIRTIYQTDTDA